VSKNSVCAVDVDIKNPLIMQLLKEILKELYPTWLLDPEPEEYEIQAKLPSGITVKTATPDQLREATQRAREDWENFGVTVKGIRIAIPTEEAVGQKSWGQRYAPSANIKGKGYKIVSLGKRADSTPLSTDIQAVLKRKNIKNPTPKDLENARKEAEKINKMTGVHVDAHFSDNKRDRTDSKGNKNSLTAAEDLQDKIRRAAQAAAGIQRAKAAAEKGVKFGKQPNLPIRGMIQTVANAIRSDASNIKGRCTFTGNVYKPITPTPAPRPDLEEGEEERIQQGIRA